jgi:GT2 family glycosyltransferase
MVQHGGVIGGQYGGLAGHVGNHWHSDDPGYLFMNHLTQRFSAVTAACLLLRKTDYTAVNGLNPRAFPVAFNDVDLCLKLRRRGLSVVWTPNARLIHAESATRGKDDAPEKAARAQREMAMLREHWGNALLNDPAYNPNLALDVHTPPFTALALPPRTGTARTNALKL